MRISSSFRIDCVNCLLFCNCRLATVFHDVLCSLHFVLSRRSCFTFEGLVECLQYGGKSQVGSFLVPNPLPFNLSSQRSV